MRERDNSHSLRGRGTTEGGEPLSLPEMERDESLPSGMRETFRDSAALRGIRETLERRMRDTEGLGRP